MSDDDLISDKKHLLFETS